MRAFSLMLFCFMAAEAFGQDCDSRPAFLLVGQSNMTGMAAVEPADIVPDKRILVQKYNPLGSPWYTAKDPLKYGVSIGFNFAKAYADAHPGKLVGLYPMAVNGSSITTWAVGADNFVKAVDAASQIAPVYVAGILWHQGEKDSTIVGAAPEFGYRDKLVAVLQAFRERLGDVPIVLGEVAQRSVYTTNINAQIHAASALLPNSVVVSTGDLTTIEGIHFDAASTRLLGRRYYEAFTTLVPSSPPPTTPEPYCILAYK